MQQLVVLKFNKVYELVMKIPIILIFVMFFGSTLIGYSSGQGSPNEDPSLPEVSLQLVLRNSEGQLVVYVEPSLKWLRNISLIHEYLDTVNDRNLITKDGKNYEQIQFERIETGFSGQITAYSLWYKGYPVLTFTHDGYMAQTGDVITASWKIIRTIP